MDIPSNRFALNLPAWFSITNSHLFDEINFIKSYLPKVFKKKTFKVSVEVTFVDGVTGTVDVSGLINSDRPGVFVALRDDHVFNAVFLEHVAVTWPGELDLAPDAMYDEIKAKGEWVLEGFDS